MTTKNPYLDSGLHQVWDEDYKAGLEDHKAGLLDGADRLRKMLAVMQNDKDDDIARCATLLLQGMNS